MSEKARAVPTTSEIMSRLCAKFRSLSENHLLQMIMWQLMMKGAEHATRIVPNKIGQN